MTRDHALAIAAIVILVVGPLLLFALGRRRTRGAPAPATPRRAWTRTLHSALLYTLAFDLSFLIQELFLVLPKAVVPGLRPTLFHNDHRWEGDNPLAPLFQGTGVLALLASGALCALLLHRLRRASTTLRLWLFWMTYCGFFMALPQVVVGAIGPRSDWGMAMASLGVDDATTTACALAALVAMPLVALRLGAVLPGFAQRPDEIADARARTRFVFTIATRPALLALPLIVAFRVPREWIEVVMVPAVVTGVGVAWMQAGAWRATEATANGDAKDVSLAGPLAAVVGLLLVFQLVLRPGIRFY